MSGLSRGVCLSPTHPRPLVIHPLMVSSLFLHVDLLPSQGAPQNGSPKPSSHPHVTAGSHSQERSQPRNERRCGNENLKSPREAHASGVYSPLSPDHPLACSVSRHLHTLTPFIAAFLSCRTSTHHNSNTFDLKWAFRKPFQIPQYLSYYNLLVFISPSTSSEFTSAFKLLSCAFKRKFSGTG